MSCNYLVNNKEMARQNGIVQPLLTDLYQITMAYAYWKSGKVADTAVFDLFFRTNPFQGEFTIFAGLEECLKFLENFHYSDSDIEYLVQTLPANIEPAFFEYLKDLTCKDIKLSAIEEGSVAFPRVPLLRVEGPLIIAQILETTLLTLVNFASLMATNAARYRMVAGKNISLLEFGLRRAQGPDGGLSASKYSYVGGFDGTSNVLAGKMFNIPVKGTHAHSFVTSFSTLDDLHTVILRHAETQKQCNLLELAVEWRRRLSAVIDVSPEEASDGELAALISYAQAFPSGFLALVDTYDVKRSGLLNFCAVALALNDCGYKAVGIRIDSGDLAYLSVLARDTFQQVAEQFQLPWFSSLTIVASNDINEETILSLHEQGHSIDCFGIGTHLDLYQITMAYAYWKSGKVADTAVFDLFFRTNPFQGEFTIFAGLEECLKFLENFHYSDSDIEYLVQTLPANIEPAFFEYLKDLTCKDIKLSAIEEGSVAFPRVPLLRVEGPLIIAQILETTLLTLVNFASLMATNAARYRMVAGKNISLLEFGLRRAQGPDGGLSASKYSYVGGFDGTSNVLAGKMFNIPVKGTHAHSFVTSFSTLDDLHTVILRHAETQKQCNLLELAVEWRRRLSAVIDVSPEEASDGELAALISYAQAFPSGFLALVDTYDVKRSGLLNFCAVALALNDCGYKAVGIRIDSGDLAYLSVLARDTFQQVAEQFQLPWFSSLTIVASNDINEETILSLHEQGHSIDCFGIGTHLVTCQRQPALGCVYKLVEINGQPRIKLSQDVGKVTIPGHKEAYRLFGADGHALIDLLQRSSEPAPEVGQKVLCRHPFQESKRAYVIPSKVEHLYKVYWKEGRICIRPKPLAEVRERVQASLRTLRQDIKRNLNPTPYKVAVSDDLYTFIHELWLQNAPIGELS